MDLNVCVAHLEVAGMITGRGVEPQRTDLELSRHQDMITGRLIVQLRTYVWSRKIADQQVRYPATWWDAVKVRWFPLWALRRWPARNTVVEFIAHHDYPSLRVQSHTPHLRIERYAHNYTAGGDDE